MSERKFGTYMVSQQCTFVNLFNHILLLLFFANMFQSLLWPLSVWWLITRIHSVYK